MVEIKRIFPSHFINNQNNYVKINEIKGQKGIKLTNKQNYLKECTLREDKSNRLCH